MITITPNKRIGYHVTPESTFAQTIIQNNSLWTFQMYLGNPKSWNHRQLTTEDIQISRDLCLRNNRSVYVHACLLLHLGQPPMSKPKPVSWLNSMFQQIQDIPSSIVVHIGKAVGANVNNVIDSLNMVNTPSSLGRNKHRLVLENAAGEGYEIGKNWDELRQIFDRVDSRIGLCIDTQHAFGAGMVDWRSEDRTSEMFRIIDDYFPDRLQTFHLNDSGVPFGQCVDAHGGTLFGSGYIYSNPNSHNALKYLLRESFQRELDLILETANPKYGCMQLHDPMWYNVL